MGKRGNSLEAGIETFSDIRTPIEALRILKERSAHVFLLESMEEQSMARIDTGSVLFKGLPETIPVARYHSLSAEADTMPECLRITAKTEDGEIMGVEHGKYPVYGLQFHPESILTPDGMQIIRNFIKIDHQ